MRTGRLLFKIYLGCIVTVLVGFGLSFAYLAQFRSARQQEMSQSTEHFVVDLAERRRDPGALTAEVVRLKKYGRFQVSLYTPEGRLLASTVEPPLPMIAETDRAQLLADGQVRLSRGQIAHAIMESGQLAAIGVATHRGMPPGGPLASIGAFLVLLMIAAVVLARHLAEPLRRIASAAERFGRGELSARTGVHRNDEIGVAAQAFDEMADRVTWLMRAQQELMANVSHELRTPLSRIHVAIDLLTDGVTTQAKDLLPEMAQDLAELERLIEDVMEVARLDLSRSRDPRASTPLKIELHSVKELLHKASRRFRSQHQGHKLIVELALELPLLSVDAVLVRRAIENLLDNARKYSDPESTIRMTADPSPKGVRIVVSDAGIGMDAADLQQIFTPFFRSDRSRSRATGGVGLGLVLTRRVVEAHGGTIDLISAPGRGTQVTIELPSPQTPSARHS